MAKKLSTIVGGSTTSSGSSGSSILKGYIVSTMGGRVSKATNSALTGYLPDGIKDLSYEFTPNHPKLINATLIENNGTVFVMVSQSTAVAQYSTDGKSWTQSNLPFAATWVSIANNGSVFCVVANDQNRGVISTDGITWTSLVFSKLYDSIGWANIKSIGTKLIVSAANRAAYSTDNAATWTYSHNVGIPFNTVTGAIAWGNNQFCMTNGSSTAISTDGLIWHQRQAISLSGAKTMAYGNGMFITLSNNASYYTSANGITWTARKFNLTTTYDWRKIIWTGTKFCAVAYSSDAAIISTDGITWTRSKLPVSSYWNNVAWNGTIFCAIPSNSNNICATSTDGITWTARTLPSTNTWIAISSNTTTFCVIAGNSNVSATSTDCITWVQNTSFPANSTIVYDISWDGSKFVTILYNTNLALTSTDGNTWNQTRLETAMQMQGICSNTSGLTTVGYYGLSVSAALNGSTWSYNTGFTELHESCNYGALAYGNNKFVTLYQQPNTTTCSLSTDGIHWTANNTGIAASWSGLAWNGNIFCAVTSTGGIGATSTDGYTWTQRTLPINGTYTSIIWNGTMFLATMAGSSSYVITSTDGITWAQRTLPATINVYTAVWGNNIFVIAADSTATAYTSTDAITWTSRTLPATASWQKLMWNGTNFLVVASGAINSAYSTDGITWTSSTTPTSGSTPIGVVLDDNSFFLTGFTNTSSGYRSWDGITWYTVQLPITGNWTGIAYTGSKLCLINTNGSTSTTTDDRGYTWARKVPDLVPVAMKGASNGSFAIIPMGAVSSYYYKTTDGSSWLKVPTTTSRTYVAASYDSIQNRFLMVSNSGYQAIISSNGIDSSSYTGFNTNLSLMYRAIIYTGSKFCAISSSSQTVATSINGIHWNPGTRIPVGLSSIYSGIAWSGSLFCVLGYNSNRAAISTDGITWTRQTLPVTANWREISWGSGVFCAIADASSIAITSTDGITWTQRALPVSAAWMILERSSTVFCAIARDTAIAATSTDGITWTQRTLPSTRSWAAIKWGGGKFVVGHENASVNQYMLNSTDGITWSEITLAQIYGGVMNLTYGNGRFVCAVWSSNIAIASTDGITWSSSSMNTGTSYNYIACCWGDNKFVAYSTTAGQIVSYSYDGITWETTPSNSMLPRMLGSSLNVGNYNGKFICVNSNGYVITSTDTVTWQTSPTSGIIESATQTLPFNFGGDISSTSSTIVVLSGSTVGVVYSTDGAQTWKESVYQTSALCIAKKGSTYCAANINAANLVYYSTNLTIWTPTVLPFNINGGTLIANNNIFALFASARYYTSTDGISWTMREYPITTISGTPLAIWNGSVFCIVTAAGSMYRNTMTSTDGVTWSIGSTASTGTWSCIAWNGSVFCIVNNTSIINTSTDGLTWKAIALDSQYPSFPVVANKGTELYIFGAAYMLKSIDNGNTWVSYRTPADIQAFIPKMVFWSGSIFYAFSAVSSVDFLTSTDGYNWIKRSLPPFALNSGSFYCNTATGEVLIPNNNRILDVSIDTTKFEVPLLLDAGLANAIVR